MNGKLPQCSTYSWSTTTLFYMDTKPEAWLCTKSKQMESAIIQVLECRMLWRQNYLQMTLAAFNETQTLINFDIILKVNASILTLPSASLNWH